MSSGERVTACIGCGAAYKPIGLFFNQVPGMSCDCQWQELSRKEFRERFGFSFHRTRLSEYGCVIGNTFVARGGIRTGNSKQRRQQRRAAIRRLRHE